MKSQEGMTETWLKAKRCLKAQQRKPSNEKLSQVGDILEGGISVSH